MVYYTIIKDLKIVGIGFGNSIPNNCKIYTYKKQSKKEYLKFDKILFNAK